METIFGISISSYMEFNYLLLAISTIFFSMSNVRDSIIKNIQKYEQKKTSEDSCKEIAEKESINAFLTKKANQILKLNDDIGLIFRQGIYCTAFNIIMITFYYYVIRIEGAFESYITPPLEICVLVLNTVFSSVIVVFSVIGLYHLLLNVHKFKYIYHFDASGYYAYIKAIKNYSDDRTNGFNVDLIERRIEEYKEIKKVKSGLVKRIKCLIPRNPYLSKTR